MAKPPLPRWCKPKGLRSPVRVAKPRFPMRL